MIFKLPDRRHVRQLHIPRTAGRYVRNIMNKNFEPVSPEIYPPVHIVDNQVWEHVHVKTAKQYESGIDLPVHSYFTVIRHPVDRFESGFSMFSRLVATQRYDRPVEYIDTYEKFVEIMTKTLFRTDLYHQGLTQACFGLQNEVTQWFQFQSKWIDDDVKVWRYEDGFGDDFAKWMQDNVCFGHLPDVRNIEYEKRQEYDLAKYLNRRFPQFKEFAQQFYAEDTRSLGYDV